MKTLKVLALFVAFTFSASIFANANPTSKVKPKTVTETVGELLKNPYFQLDKDVKAKVSITLNRNNEMVVLSVDTDNEIVENYIKDRLNYQELSKDLTITETSFVVPVRIVKSI